MKLMKSILSAIAAASAAVLSTPRGAYGAPLTFFGEDRVSRSSCTVHPNSDAARVTFLSYLSASHDESFESFTDGQSPPLNLPFDNAGVTATLVGTINVNSGEVQDDGFASGEGVCPIEGDLLFWHKPFSEDRRGITITFDQPVAAFGHYGVGVGDAGGNLVVNTVSGVQKTFNVPHPVGDGINGATYYHAIIDLEDPFTSAELRNIGSTGDGFLYDLLTAATPAEVFQVAFDIKPGNCPNAFNPKSKGVLPTAILGTENFDVTDIDVDTIQLCNSADVCIDPRRTSIEDVATPCIACASTCGCNLDGPDSFADLTVKFDSKQVATLVAGAAVGDFKPLEVRFSDTGGEDYAATDCVKIVGNPNQRRLHG